VAEDSGIHGPDHIKIGVGIAAKAVEGSKEVRRFEGHHLHIAAIRNPECRGGRIEKDGTALTLGSGQDAAVAIDQIGGREAAVFGQIAEEAGIGDRRIGQGRRRRIERLRHVAHAHTDRALLFAEVASGDCGRVLDHGLHAGVEPVVDPARHQHAEEERDDYGRGHGGQGEKEDEPQVQPGAGVA